MNCWSPPPTMPEGETLRARRVASTFNADGSLSGRPVLVNPPRDPAWRAHADSAMRAAMQVQSAARSRRNTRPFSINGGPRRFTSIPGSALADDQTTRESRNPLRRRSDQALRRNCETVCIMAVAVMAAAGVLLWKPWAPQATIASAPATRSVAALTPRRARTARAASQARRHPRPRGAEPSPSPPYTIAPPAAAADAALALTHAGDAAGRLRHLADRRLPRLLDAAASANPDGEPYLSARARRPEVGRRARRRSQNSSIRRPTPPGSRMRKPRMQSGQELRPAPSARQIRALLPRSGRPRRCIFDPTRS